MSGSQQLLLGGSVQQAVDPYFYSVTSLLHGDGTNGGQNNTFLDSSTNNFTITRNGNTTQGSFSPFSQTGWGNYFDGTGDYLTVPSNAAFSQTADFSEDCWVYITGNPANGTYQYFGAADGNPYFQIGLNGSGKFVFVKGYVGDLIASSATAVANTWYHIAITRVSNTCRLFVNGILQGTATDSSSTATTATGFTISGVLGGSYVYPFTGYISNFRFVRGGIPSLFSTSSTTAGAQIFTPPTTAYTGSESLTAGSVSLLTCQANRFRDASTNNFTITRNGDVSVQPFSPFNPTTAYSTSAIGGSGYFDGSGDFLQVADAAPMELGSGNWTIEMWVNTLNNTQYSALFTRDDGGTTTGSYVILLNTTSANGIVTFWSADVNSFTAAVLSSGTTSCRDGAWHHIAVVRNSNTLTMYIDGTATSTASFSGSFGNTAQPLKIGSETGYSRDYTGYISNVRLVVGTAVYTSNFTPPTAPLTAITNTQLLLNYTNGAIFDNAAVADYETVGNAQINTSVKKYGTGSLAFDGTGDYLVTDAPSTQLMTFGTGDFTIEFWLYVAAFPSAGTYKIIYDSRPNSTQGLYPTITLKGSTIVYYTNSADRIASGSISATTWYHVALCRTASQTKLFINGTQAGSTYADTNSYINVASRPLIGDSGFAPSSTDGLNGYIDDLRVSKGVARYPYNFTPPTAEFPNIGGTVTLTADPYFDYTTLLLPGNGTNGAQNNTFLDSSTNAFSITRNGNTTQGTFSPFSQTGWGNYFASGAIIRAGSSANLSLGSGAFTCECWVYPTAFTTIYAALWDFRSGANFQAAAPLIWIGTDGKVNYQNASIASSSALALNQWTHVAIVRNGTTVTMYFNGTSVGSVTDSTTMTNTFCAIGAVNDIPATYYVTGYISNSRVVAGTAVYTANFTPPTAPLTAISGTSFLTCQSNRFVDNSSNAFAITVTNSPSIQAFSPFNPTAAWSAATNGGSGYFDGSGDYLTAPNNTAFDFGSGNWTVETWVYPSSLASPVAITSKRTNTDADYRWIVASINTNGTINTQITTTGSSWAINANTTSAVSAGQWSHIAWVRNGSDVSVYVNGVKNTLSSGFSGSLFVSTEALNIGVGGTTGTYIYPMNGYMSDFRIVKGTAVYTAAFTPPTAPLTAISGTSLLTNYTNAGIADATSKNDLETVGNAQISTTQSKFGGSSMYFDGTDDRLLVPTSPNLTFGTGDFTIEAWVNRSTSGSVIHFIDFRGSNNDGSNPVFYWQTNNFIYYTNSNTTGDNQIQTSNAITSSSGWVHLAIVRFGTTLTVYVNGIASGSTTYSTNVLGGNPVTIANRFNNSGAYTGYIDDLRITKGIARYTSNFTPPTTAFLTQ